MLTSGIRFWIVSISVLLLLFLTLHPTTTSYLYQTSSFLASIGFRLLSLLLAFVLVIAFHGIGLLICPLIGLKLIPKHMEVPTRFFIGYLLACVAVYFLGFAEMLHKEIFIPLILFGASISIHKINTVTPNNLFHLKTLQKENLGKWVIICIGFFLLGRIFPILNFNSFGDPLFYSLPAGRDYLKAGGFQWFEQAEFYWQVGLSDIGLIYLHSLTSHPMSVSYTHLTLPTKA